MIKRITLLAGMILFDTYLHWQDVWYGSGTSNWFWFDTIRQYDVFWYTYWGLGSIIILSMGIGWFIRKRKYNQMKKGMQK